MSTRIKESEPTTIIQRADGVTEAERYLKRLCDRTFLSLWSYPGIYRDQGKANTGGHGKEVCDLLVVFENHLIIFSDKDCKFPDTGDLDLDWSRWYRKAIQESAQQIWGAERWILSHPDRLYMDRGCTKPFPIALPSPETVKVHRVLVAHGVAERCRNVRGGSGSLWVVTDITGDQHYLKRADGGTPFAIGQIDPAKGYIHVLDDTTLDIVLTQLDTVSDFVSYLEKKERVIEAGRSIFAPGEEDLLGFYLMHLNETGEHDFPQATEHEAFIISEGFWGNFLSSPQHKAQIEANNPSYIWDRLIETFLSPLYAGTSYYVSHSKLSDQELIFRLTARENRVARRLLSQAFIEFAQQPPAIRPMTRTLIPGRSGGAYYLFLALAYLPNISYEVYREQRIALLQAYCRILKSTHPEAEHIIGIAIERSERKGGSEDILYLDAREWTPKLQAEAEQMRQEFKKQGFIGERHYHHWYDDEFPVLPDSRIHMSRILSESPMKGRERNAICICGSGKKFKKCCGA